MQKFYLLFVIAIFFNSNLTAQDVTFGLKGGVNISNVIQDTFDGESITAWHAGGVMESLFTDKIALQTEILFSVQGFTGREGDTINEFSLTYINVPVMFKYYVGQGIAFEAGPQIGFLNTAKLKSTVNDDTQARNIKDGLRSNDLSFNLGLGFHVKSGLFISARYCHGLTNITNRLSDEKFKNTVLQLSLGYFF